jgi:hypothetical protein
VDEEWYVESLPIVVHHVNHPEYRLRFSGSPMVRPGGVVVLPDLLLLPFAFGYKVSDDELLPDFLFTNLQLHTCTGRKTTFTIPRIQLLSGTLHNGHSK